MTRWTAAPAVVIALLCLPACSSASAPASTTPPSTQRTAPASSTPSGATGIPVSVSPPTTSTTSTTPNGAYPAVEVCTYLRSQIPTLTAIGTPVGREANLTANLFTFFSDHGIAPDGAQLDAATTAQCSDVRSQLLTLTGLTSLAEM